MKRDLTTICIITFLTLGMCSCGVRKTQKTETVEQTASASSSSASVVEVSESELNKQTAVSEENFTIEAIDTIKPIEITDASGKVTKYKNAKLKYQSKISTEKTAYSDKTVKTSDSRTHTAVSVEKKHTEKKTEREFPFGVCLILSFMVILVIVVIGLAYYRERVYREELNKII